MNRLARRLFGSNKRQIAKYPTSSSAIESFIDREVNQNRQTEAVLAIVGFSDGTMMALHVGLRRPRHVA